MYYKVNILKSWFTDEEAGSRWGSTLPKIAQFMFV